MVKKQLLALTALMYASVVQISPPAQAVPAGGNSACSGFQHNSSGHQWRQHTFNSAGGSSSCNSGSKTSTGGQLWHTAWSSSSASGSSSSGQLMQHSYVVGSSNREKWVGGSNSKHANDSGSGHWRVTANSSNGSSSGRQHWESRSGATSGLLLAPGPYSSMTIPGFNATSINSQISSVISNDWASWTGFSLTSTSKSNVLTLAEVGQLLSNPKITGSQAAVLGTIANYMYAMGDTQCSASQVSSFMTGNGGNQSGNFYNYYTAMVQIASATNASGTFSLYGSFTGPQLSQIEQGNLGDCFLIAAVGGVLNENPKLIANMITQNANGTYTVSFPGASKETVTLTDGEIAEGSLAQSTPGTSTVGNGAWLTVVSLAEDDVLSSTPGYGLTTAQKDTPLGDITLGGYPTQTFSVLTGQTYSSIGNTQKSDWTTAYVNQLLTTAFAGNTPIGVTSNDHALDITAFNVKTDMVTIWNPWGVSGTYQPEGNSRATVSMTNGYFTISVSTLLTDFVGLDAPLSLINSTVVSSSGHTASSWLSQSLASSLNLSSPTLTAHASTPGFALNAMGSTQAIATDEANQSGEFTLQQLQATLLAPGQAEEIVSADGNGREDSALQLDSLNFSADWSYGGDLTDDQVYVRQQNSSQFPDESKDVLVAWHPGAEPNFSFGVEQDASMQHSSSDSYQVGQGSLLVLQDRRAKVNTQRACIEVAPGAGVFVVQIDREVMVSNLCDRHHGDVLVRIGKESLSVPMGKVIVVSGADCKDPSTMPMAAGLKLTNLKSAGTFGDACAYSGNFSYATILANCPQFHKLAHSNLLEERRVAGRLLKSSAAYITASGAQ